MPNLQEGPEHMPQSIPTPADVAKQATPTIPTQAAEPQVPVAPDPQETETPTEVSGEQQAEASPPWTAEDFDPERAWNLVTNLRQEVAALKEQAQQAEAPAEEAPAEAPAAEERPAEESSSDGPTIQQMQQELQKTKALAGAGLSLDLVALIPDGDTEAIAANVNRLVQLQGAPTGGSPKTPGRKSPSPDPAQVAEPVINDKNQQAQAFFGF